MRGRWHVCYGSLLSIIIIHLRIVIAILCMWYIYEDIQLFLLYNISKYIFLLYPNIYYSFYLLNMLVLCYLCVLQCCDVDGVYVKVSPISKIVY